MGCFFSPAAAVVVLGCCTDCGYGWCDKDGCSTQYTSVVCPMQSSHQWWVVNHRSAKRPEEGSPAKQEAASEAVIKCKVKLLCLTGCAWIVKRHSANRMWRGTSDTAGVDSRLFLTGSPAFQPFQLAGYEWRQNMGTGMPSVGPTVLPDRSPPCLDQRARHKGLNEWMLNIPLLLTLWDGW